MEHSFYIDPRPVSTGSRYVKVASGAVSKRYEENLLHPTVGSTVHVSSVHVSTMHVSTVHVPTVHVSTVHVSTVHVPQHICSNLRP